MCVVFDLPKNPAVNVFLTCSRCEARGNVRYSANRDDYWHHADSDQLTCNECGAVLEIVAEVRRLVRVPSTRVPRPSRRPSRRITARPSADDAGGDA